MTLLMTGRNLSRPSSLFQPRQTNLLLKFSWVLFHFLSYLSRGGRVLFITAYHIYDALSEPSYSLDTQSKEGKPIAPQNRIYPNRITITSTTLPEQSMSVLRLSDISTVAILKVELKYWDGSFVLKRWTYGFDSKHSGAIGIQSTSAHPCL